MLNDIQKRIMELKKEKDVCILAHCYQTHDILEVADFVGDSFGLAQKAGKIVSGEFATEKAVKTGKAALVIVAGDASENTKKMFTNMCAFYEVPVYFYSDKETLGHAIGKQFRASLAVADEGFRNTIEKHLKNGLEQQM